MNRNRTFMLIAAGCLSALVFAVLAYRTHLLEDAALTLDVGQTPEPADWIFLLPGDFDNRPLAAAALYTAGYGRRVILPTNRRTIETESGDGYAVDQILTAVLRARGVPSDAIETVDNESDSTIGDALALKQLWMKSPETRVILVTNDFHTRRTNWIFKQVLGPAAEGKLQIVGIPHPKVSAHNWWQSRTGFVIMTSEFVKLAAYRLRYGYDGYWLLGFIGSVTVIAFYFRAPATRRRNS
ncbi:MAG: YdcF family protein [Planctomycetaceae bacterium]|nr:YdcF family protein [Planctomycetaceae bacterium]